MDKPTIYSAYNTPEDKGFDTGKETTTQQHFKDECDINKIMERYEKTGIIDIPDQKGIFGDFGDVSDYQSALHLMQDAQNQFMELPAKVRAKFDNDPSKLLHFIQNPANKAEAQELGLIEAAPLPAPIKVGDPVKTSNNEPLKEAQ
jgi:phage internal scaffolding protein